MYASSGALGNITGCTFTSNMAKSGGAAILADDNSHLQISSCAFLMNGNNTAADPPLVCPALFHRSHLDQLWHLYEQCSNTTGQIKLQIMMQSGGAISLGINTFKTTTGPPLPAAVVHMDSSQLTGNVASVSGGAISSTSGTLMVTVSPGQKSG